MLPAILFRPLEWLVLRFSSYADTAIRISEQLDIPLDTLTNGRLSPLQIRRMDGFMSHLGWYDRLTEEKQKGARHHVRSLLQLMQEGSDE